MPEHADKKKRLSIYLDPELMLLLADYADRRGKSRSLVAEAAIASFLTPDADERQEAALTRRLDRIDRSIQRLERDIGIANEAFAIFMRSWLTATPAPPDAASRAQGGERYDRFLEALGRRLVSGPRLRQEVPGDSDQA
ncbi:ribbon-helix-helix protein, CopG family [Paracoccus sp. MKU1]|uniref:ribbon-helix-helix protein, CopG family n=1 Tax=Paracoccus sp. MKU1 TaxID=1745182 RepID=UPI00071921ED|nr:ribbon-helix-helix protein, CopG family [Paracoccus sp. MKU1]KRW96180.1 CopG family transcriptional regulator [Paracoccus sp. MKU1]